MKWLSSVSGTIVTLESIISLYMRLLLVNARVKLVSGAAIDRFRIKKKFVLKEKAVKQYYYTLETLTYAYIVLTTSTFDGSCCHSYMSLIQGECYNQIYNIKDFMSMLFKLHLLDNPSTQNPICVHSQIYISLYLYFFSCDS